MWGVPAQTLPVDYAFTYRTYVYPTSTQTAGAVVFTIGPSITQGTRVTQEQTLPSLTDWWQSRPRRRDPWEVLDLSWTVDRMTPQSHRPPPVRLEDASIPPRRLAVVSQVAPATPWLMGSRGAPTERRSRRRRIRVWERKE